MEQSKEFPEIRLSQIRLRLRNSAIKTPVLGGESQIRDTDCPSHQRPRPSWRLPERHFPIWENTLLCFYSKMDRQTVRCTAIYPRSSLLFGTDRRTALITMHSFSDQKMRFHFERKAFLMTYWKLSQRMEDIPVIKKHNGGALTEEPLFFVPDAVKINPSFFVKHNALNGFPALTRILF